MRRNWPLVVLAGTVTTLLTFNFAFIVTLLLLTVGNNNDNNSNDQLQSEETAPYRPMKDDRVPIPSPMSPWGG